MEYVYLGAIIGLCFFNFFAYRRGLKDGLALNQGRAIEPIQNPVQAYTERREQKVVSKETKAANDAMAAGMLNIFSYDGNPQKPKEGEK